MAHRAYIASPGHLSSPMASLDRPERFNNLPQPVLEVPTMFGNQMTFSGGAKGCIGWRLAILECVPCCA